MSYRIERVNELLHQEVSKILPREVEFKDCIVTVTNVKTVPSLLSCDVLITVIPEKKEKDALAEIRASLYEIQKIINKRLNIKKVPRLFFKIDEGAKNLYKIDKISSYGKKRPKNNFQEN